VIFVNALPGLPLAAVAAAARAGIDGAAEALRLELAPSGVEVLVVATELAVPPTPQASPLDAFEMALAQMPPDAPQLVLADPLRALLDRAATHDAIAAEVASTLLASRPKARVTVRGRGRLLGARAIRALERAAAPRKK
jgi:NAD(P)-dependent dehydrogenase (short-subunit alcohol dehydrogenase family)